MASLERLLINGFRSYCYLNNGNDDQRKLAQEEQKIEFKKPLTLIWGHNGSGKTTIIECLKLITSGQHPPNSDRGKTFLTDSQLLKATETQSVLQLDFTTFNQQHMTIRRHYKVACFEKSLSINSLRSTLHYTHPQTGEHQTISQTCVEMDTKIPQLLNVSQSILTHVIFCHQEEQFWIFSDNQTLKKIFDELFDTTKFAKMQDWIKDSVKKNSAEMKKVHDSIILAKRDVEDVCRSRETITKELFLLHTESFKLKSAKEILDQYKKKGDPALIGRLNLQINDLQSKVTLLKYKITENHEKIKDIVISSNEQKLSKDSSDLKVKQVEMQQQLEKVQQNLLKLQREEESKKYELQQLEECDNQEVSLQQEIKQIKVQIGSISALVKNESDETLLKRIKHEVILIQGQHEAIIKENEDKLLELQMEEFQIDEQRNKEQVLFELCESKVDFLKREKDRLNAELGKIGQQYTQPRQTDQQRLKLQHLNEKNDKEIEIYNETQKKLQDVNYCFISINCQIQIQIQDKSQQMRKLKPFQEYVGYKTEIMKLNQQQQDLTALIKDLNRSGSSETKANASKQLSLIQNELNAQTQKNNEYLVKLQHLDELLEQCQSQIQGLQQQLQQKGSITQSRNYKELLENAKQKYNDSKEDLIKFAYSSGEFIEQYIQGSTQSRKCIICQKGLEIGDINGVKDRQMKNTTKVKGIIDTKRKLVLQYKQEKDALKTNKEVFCKLEEAQKKSKGISEQKEQLTLQKKQSELLIEALITQVKQWEKEIQNLEKIQQSQIQINQIRGDIQNIQQKQNKILQQYPEFKDELKDADLGETIQNEISYLTTQSQLMNNKLSDSNNQREKLKQMIKQTEKELNEIEDQNKSQQRNRERVGQLQVSIEESTAQLKERYKQIPLLQQALVDLKLKKQMILDRLRIQEKQKEAQLQPLTQSITLYQNIIPLFETKLTKLKDLKSVKTKSNKNQVIEEQKRTIQRDIEKIEADITKSVQLQEKLDTFLNENSLKIQEIDRQLKAIEISTQNNKMKKDIQDYSAQLGQDQAELQNLQQAMKDKDRMEVQIQADKQKMLERFNRCNEQKSEQEIRFRNVEQKYLQLIFQEESLKAINDDLVKYQKDAEQTLISYHREKMEEINKSINETWKMIYEGDDINRIFIRSDEEPSTSKKNSKSYYYRIVMETGSGVELDMRGRCSMGQKVLASIVIRMALSESFGNNCGILALDEPTTNLDKVHIEKLAWALCKLIELMQQYKQNLQLIIITHDKDLVKMMGKFTDTYICVTKRSTGFSKIQQLPIDQISL